MLKLITLLAVTSTAFATQRCSHEECDQRVAAGEFFLPNGVDSDGRPVGGSPKMFGDCFCIRGKVDGEQCEIDDECRTGYECSNRQCSSRCMSTTCGNYQKCVLEGVEPTCRFVPYTCDDSAVFTVQAQRNVSGQVEQRSFINMCLMVNENVKNEKIGESVWVPAIGAGREEL